MDMGRRLFAEGVGSALLFSAVIGSGIMAQDLADGNLAVALLGNTLATAAMIFVLITMLGPVSGAHFNPAVTLVFALRREISVRDAALYVLVQLVCGLAGVLAAHAMFGLTLIQTGTMARTGPGQWLGEAIATFALLFTILGTRQNRPQWLPVSVALAITAGYWFTSSTSFANPAITVARALTNSFSGIRPMDVPGFVAAQLLGAVCAAGCNRWLFERG